MRIEKRKRITFVHNPKRGLDNVWTAICFGDCDRCHLRFVCLTGGDIDLTEVWEIQHSKPDRTWDEILLSMAAIGDESWKHLFIEFDNLQSYEDKMNYRTKTYF